MAHKNKMSSISVQFVPAVVSVSDAREAVAGAAVSVSGACHGGGEVIPQEGDCLSQWAGGLADIALPEGSDAEFVDLLAEAANEGAAGRSGTLRLTLEDGVWLRG